MPLYLVTCIAFLVLVRPPMLQLSWEKIALQIGSHLVFLHNLPFGQGIAQSKLRSLPRNFGFLFRSFGQAYKSRIDLHGLPH